LRGGLRDLPGLLLQLLHEKGARVDPAQVQQLLREGRGHLAELVAWVQQRADALEGCERAQHEREGCREADRLL